MGCAERRFHTSSHLQSTSHSSPERESLQTDRRQKVFIWYTLSFHHLFKTWKDGEEKENIEATSLFDGSRSAKTPSLAHLGCGLKQPALRTFYYSPQSLPEQAFEDMSPL